MTKQANSLIDAQSPYLLQHAYNPVHWIEWSTDVLKKAKAEHKLIIVSIGYSACHWCHVMEHESFEDEQTAAIMNDHFICVKVDREERPDIDQIYMDAVQLLTGRGGWPLNVITLPDGRPIYGGTYFPKAEWQKVLLALVDVFNNKPDEAYEYATQLSNGIKKLDIFEPKDASHMGYDAVLSILKPWQKNFDMEKGGFNWAPKFPMPAAWEFFMHLSMFEPNEQFNRAVNQTLTCMANGGIYDHLEGGFARYSTDADWHVPHFEKMLYDNAQLIKLYSLGFAKNHDDLYKKTVFETVNFLEKNLMHPSGYFYSALDADSEGEEGKFYVWTFEEIHELLGENAPAFCTYFNITSNGNWEHNNVLHITESAETLERKTGYDISDLEELINGCKEILLNERNKRTKPGLDDKAICSWNALTIEALCIAFKTFQHKHFLSLAEQAAWHLEHSFMNDAKLKRIYKNNKAFINAFAEDYATAIWAFLSLYEASGNENYLNTAHQWMLNSIDLFYDDTSKLFYFNSVFEPTVITRKIDVNDDVIPSSNAIFARCLWRLGYFFSKPEFHKMSKEMLLRVEPKFERYPLGFSCWMQLMVEQTKPFYQIVVSGKNSMAAYENLQTKYLPNSIISLVTEPTKIPLLADKEPIEKTQFYVCIDKTCLLPFTTLEEALTKITF